MIYLCVKDDNDNVMAWLLYDNEPVACYDWRREGTNNALLGLSNAGIPDLRSVFVLHRTYPSTALVPATHTPRTDIQHGLGTIT